jgi:hypothetical protein
MMASTNYVRLTRCLGCLWNEFIQALADMIPSENYQSDLMA